MFSGSTAINHGLVIKNNLICLVCKSCTLVYFDSLCMLNEGMCADTGSVFSSNY